MTGRMPEDEIVFLRHFYSHFSKNYRKSHRIGVDKGPNML